MIRTEVQSLVQLGPLPPAASASVEQLETLEAALFQIIPPVSDDEAAALATVFGPDACFGFAQAIVGLIETSPAPLSQPLFPKGDNFWLIDLRERAKRSAGLGMGSEL